jgi:hypothetical protein
MGVEVVAMCGAPAANGGWRFAHQRVRVGRVTGLGLHARVMDPSCTVAAARASDRWSLQRLGVRARPGYGEPMWRVRGDVVRWCPELKNSFT